jgi:hypothetical protein
MRRKTMPVVINRSQMQNKPGKEPDKGTPDNTPKKPIKKRTAEDELMANERKKLLIIGSILLVVVIGLYMMFGGGGKPEEPDNGSKSTRTVGGLGAKAAGDSETGAGSKKGTDE